MQPGTKRIVFGGLGLAVVAWVAIGAYLAEMPAPMPEPRAADGLAPIPEVAPAARRGAAPAAAPDPRRAAIAAVLVGCFRGLREDGAVLIERYRPTADGAFEGEFTEINHDGTPAFHETLRIAPEGAEWRYRSTPDGTATAASLALVELGKGTLRFAAPGHVPPRSIVYRRIGPTLETRADGGGGGEPTSDAYSTQTETCP